MNFNLKSLSLVIFAAYIIFVNLVIEEVFWRYALNTNTKADYIIDLLYAGYHLLVLPFFLNFLGCLLAFIALIGASVIWRFVMKKYNGLSMPIITHLIADTGIIVFVIYIFSSSL